MCNPGSGCQCEEGHFKMNNNYQCQACNEIEGCLHCQDYARCAQCDALYQRVMSTECETNYYICV